jgi:hypothetical protein
MVILNGEQCWWIPYVLILLLQSQVFPDPGYGILQKLGDDCRVNMMSPPHGLGWASHHLCAKWRGIFEENILV